MVYFNLEKLLESRLWCLAPNQDLVHHRGAGNCRNKRRQAQESKILTIDVKPRWKKGRKITFPDKGNEQPNQLPADLVFVIDEKPHDLYKRDGNDLIVNKRVSLAEALGGTTINLTTDGGGGDDTIF
ncbi:hypothetical protein Gotur_018786 [Gossypium turneri]